MLFTEESDEDDERPSRRRRLAERAAEGEEDEDVRSTVDTQGREGKGVMCNGRILICQKCVSELRFTHISVCLKVAHLL